MKPTPILFTDHAPALGGAEIGLLRILDALDRRRFAPHVAAQPGQLAAAARARGVTVHEVPLRRLRHEPTAPWAWTRGTIALARIIRREQIAAVLSNTMRASFYSAAATTLTRRPFIWHVQDIFPVGPYVRVMNRLSAAVIAISQAVTAPLPKTEKLHVIYPAIDPSDFQADRHTDAERLRAAWGIPREAVLVGHIARLQPWKGQRDVIRAAATFIDAVPDAYVVIVGGDIFGDATRYESELKATVRTMGLSDRIRFAGHVHDVPAVLQAVDIVVHASDNEPFGLILIEAGAAGRPVVAYASGAAGEIVIDEQTGLLVPPGSPAALGAALQRLVVDRTRIRALGAQAHRRVCEHFGVARAAAAFAEMLDSVIDNPRSRHPTA